MKRKFFLVLCAIFTIMTVFFTLDAVGYEEKTVHRVVDKKRNLVCGTAEKPIRVAGYMNYPPFGWKEVYERKLDAIPYAIYYGVGVELFKRFAEEYDLRYQFVNAFNHEEIQYALSRGFVDVLLGDYYDANSYSSMKYFYPGYVSNPLIIVTLKSDDANAKIPETWEDLKGKKGIMRSEERLYDLLYPKIPSDVQVEKVEGAKRAFQLLLRKEADFLITSQIAYETEMRRFKVRDAFVYGQKPFLSPVIFMTYRAGNPCAASLKKKFEEKLKEYTADKDLIHSILSSQIIAWENKFMNQKSLMYERDEEPESNEEKSEKDMDLDAYLKEQKKQLDLEAIRNSAVESAHFSSF